MDPPRTDDMTMTKQSKLEACIFYGIYCVLIQTASHGWCLTKRTIFHCIDIDGLVQERRNSSALAIELRLSCTNPSIWMREWGWVCKYLSIYIYIYTFVGSWWLSNGMRWFPKWLSCNRKLISCRDYVNKCIHASLMDLQWIYEWMITFYWNITVDQQ